MGRYGHCQAINVFAFLVPLLRFFQPNPSHISIGSSISIGSVAAEVYSSSSLPGLGWRSVTRGPHLASRDGEQYFIVTVENINSSPPPTHRILHSLSSEHWAAT